jgi:hypothetical protein
LEHPPNARYLFAGLILLVLAAYALLTGDAYIPMGLGDYTVRRNKTPRLFWLIVVLLFLLATTCFVVAWLDMT